MTLDDLKKLATGSLLFSLDRIIAPRLINIFYLLGLAALVLWAINHLFFSFSLGFGGGLWGLLEIAVFGLLAFVILRIVCEAAIIFFKSNESVAKAANKTRPATSIIDDVRDAIEDLAEQQDKPVVTAKPSRAAAPKPRTMAAKSPAPRRTAKRTPPATKK